MQLPLQITARGFDLTPAIEEAVRKKASKLDQMADRIVGCRVVIEQPPRHRHKGGAYNVHIDLTVPGAELVVKHEPDLDMYVALRDAFEAARRQLLEHFDRLQERARQSHIVPEPEPGE